MERVRRYGPLYTHVAVSTLGLSGWMICKLSLNLLEARPFISMRPVDNPMLPVIA